jgi:hypothetical protein
MKSLQGGANPQPETKVEWSEAKLPPAGNEAKTCSRGEMLLALAEIEKALPLLLVDSGHWRSLDVSYHPPRVERVFMQYGEFRISLHCIHPCDTSDSLFHPHPWPSGMRVLSGKYEMAVGFGSGNTEPPIAATIVAGPGTSYEMTHPDAWHFVRPIDDVCMTLMVTGTPWARSTPKSNEPLKELSEQRKLEILDFFRARYPASFGATTSVTTD